MSRFIPDVNFSAVKAPHILSGPLRRPIMAEDKSTRGEADGKCKSKRSEIEGSSTLQLPGSYTRD